jgi:alpha/beta superfamily hydrolase
MTPSYTPQHTTISGAVGELEIMLSFPRDMRSPPKRYAVVCHPHPLHGGAMTNKVVYMITSTFNSLGLGVIRFNFRGVGKSAGQFDHGIGETEDLKAVVQWLNTHYAPEELWLAGFSFGSFVAMRAHKELAAKRLLLVAPAVERFDFANLNVSPDIPTLIIQGDKDDVVSPQAVITWVKSQSTPPEFQYLPDADHFFHGQLNALRDAICTVWRD